MKSILLENALLVIPSPQILVNVISKRVRQLSLGHRPLVVAPPGSCLSDIALLEVIEKKLTYELKPAVEAVIEELPKIIKLPVAVTKKAA